MIGIMTVRDGDMAEIVQVPVDVLIDRQDAGLHEVTEHVHTPELG